MRGRIQAAGGSLIQTIKSLAEEMGVKQERLYYLIRAFESKGEISTINHGPKGMEFRAGGGQPKAAAAAAAKPARRGGRPKAAVAIAAPRAAAPSAARPAAGANFCPFCGKEAQPAWHYCATCGQELPTVRA